MSPTTAAPTSFRHSATSQVVFPKPVFYGDTLRAETEARSGLRAKQRLFGLLLL